MAERFYLRQEFKQNEFVHLKGTEHHHVKVMRLRVGEEVELVNGDGTLAHAKVESIEKEHTSFHILNVRRQDPPKRLIYLGIPLMRPSKLEWVIEKGTEIGADAFFLYPADNSTQEILSDHQIDRLSHIMISALKQSKRLYLPHLEILPHLDSLFKKEIPIYFGDTRENAPPIEAISGNVLLITGPESGFSKNEVTLLSQNGRGVRLNANVLRAETAPLVAASLLCTIYNL
ncbi:MAG TPA: RsmE family RNA methyltransferase [Chlamydiales bacterium]|nr:RsmE family RNA methyltransferase [Chlamydiales bacterium]